MLGADPAHLNEYGSPERCYPARELSPYVFDDFEAEDERLTVSMRVSTKGTK